MTDYTKPLETNEITYTGSLTFVASEDKEVGGCEDVCVKDAVGSLFLVAARYLRNVPEKEIETLRFDEMVGRVTQKVSNSDPIKEQVIDHFVQECQRQGLFAKATFFSWRN